jgi:hypothetical protein
MRQWTTQSTSALWLPGVRRYLFRPICMHTRPSHNAQFHEGCTGFEYKLRTATFSSGVCGPEARRTFAYTECGFLWHRLLLCRFYAIS